MNDKLKYLEKSQQHNQSNDSNLNLSAASGYVNRDGTANKVHTRKMWNHVTSTIIDSFNGDINDEELLERRDAFQQMANKLTINALQ
jgi:hypothetical protein